MLTSAGLFAGIGGIELGLANAGFDTRLLCELDRDAGRVLASHFPNTELVEDVRRLKQLPKVDLVAAGFPCQDLSQAGRTAGIGGTQSGLVDEVFRLVASRKTSPRWLLLENVSFMLRLDRGAAMHHLTSSLEALGFRWAYRVVDSRSFGVPQRRQRVVLLASRDEDPRSVLFGANAAEVEHDPSIAKSFGFYWTEGLRGVGWAVDAIPTLKGGSTIGIASPPAVWHIGDDVVITPDIRDAERLQGFPSDWTAIVGHERRASGKRWKLLGNAVTVGVAEWVGKSVVAASSIQYQGGPKIVAGGAWPNAAWGDKSGRWSVQASFFPLTSQHPVLADFLEHPGIPLSVRATTGFLRRAKVSTLHFWPGFLAALERHIDRLADPDHSIQAFV